MNRIWHIQKTPSGMAQEWWSSSSWQSHIFSSNLCRNTCWAAAFAVKSRCRAFWGCCLECISTENGREAMRLQCGMVRLCLHLPTPHSRGHSGCTVGQCLVVPGLKLDTGDRGDEWRWWNICNFFSYIWESGLWCAAKDRFSEGIWRLWVRESFAGVLRDSSRQKAHQAKRAEPSEEETFRWLMVVGLEEQRSQAGVCQETRWRGEGLWIYGQGYYAGCKKRHGASEGH